MRTVVYKARKAACASCCYRTQCASKKPRPKWRRSITRMEESPEAIAFKAKMKGEAAKKIYEQRSQIAEFPHAWIKERCGLRQFRCRGKEKAGMGAIWVCLSYNVIRLFSTRRKLAKAVVASQCSGKTGFRPSPRLRKYPKPKLQNYVYTKYLTLPCARLALLLVNPPHGMHVKKCCAKFGVSHQISIRSTSPTSMSSLRRS